MESKNIVCPQCGTEVNVNEILYKQIDEDIRVKYRTALEQEKQKYELECQKLDEQTQQLTQQQANLNEQVAQAVDKQLSIEKSKLEHQLREKITNEHNEFISSLQVELDQKSQQVQELNHSKADVARLNREKDELESTINAKAEQTFNEKLKSERERLQKQISDASELKLREKEEQLNSLRNQLQEAQRKAEQGSMQLQGEAQELAIEEWLIEQFPFDSIEEIKKGQRGADCMQIVHTREAQNCGKIYYESKRTKEFQNQWIEKFKADMREKGADVGVLVSEVYPKGYERMALVDGVWVCSYNEFKGLVSVLRESVIRTHIVMRSQDNKADKMSLLYGFLTSNEFRMQVEAIVEGFSQIKSDLDAEKRAMAKLWKQREKQIDKVIDNTVNMYGSIRGIAGNAVASIQMLELPGYTENLLEDNGF